MPTRGETVDPDNLVEMDVVRWQYLPAALPKVHDPYWCKSRLAVVRYTPRWGKRLIDLYWDARTLLDPATDFFSTTSYEKSWPVEHAGRHLELTYVANMNDLSAVHSGSIAHREYEAKDVVDLSHPNAGNLCYVVKGAERSLFVERAALCEDLVRARAKVESIEALLKNLDERIDAQAALKNTE